MRRSCTEVEWFEDYGVGDEFLGEPVYFSDKEIVDFARRYDPQPFHIDPVAASASPFGGLIAPGIAIPWLKPVRPGDTLTMLACVVETRISQSRPDRGFVSFRSSVTNQNGEEVMTLSFKEMILTSPKG